jgi:hypothetical protein
VQRRIDPMMALRARIEARAILWQANAYADIDELMHPLYAYAHQSGLLDTLGIEGVDKLMLVALAERLRANDNTNVIRMHRLWQPSLPRSSGG